MNLNEVSGGKKKKKKAHAKENDVVMDILGASEDTVKEDDDNTLAESAVEQEEPAPVEDNITQVPVVDRINSEPAQMPSAIEMYGNGKANEFLEPSEPGEIYGGSMVHELGEEPNMAAEDDESSLFGGAGISVTAEATEGTEGEETYFEESVPYDVNMGLVITDPSQDQQYPQTEEIYDQALPNNAAANGNNASMDWLSIEEEIQDYSEYEEEDKSKKTEAKQKADTFEKRKNKKGRSGIAAICVAIAAIAAVIVCVIILKPSNPEIKTAEEQETEKSVEEAVQQTLDSAKTFYTGFISTMIIGETFTAEDGNTYYFDPNGSYTGYMNDANPKISGKYSLEEGKDGTVLKIESGTEEVQYIIAYATEDELMNSSWGFTLSDMNGTPVHVLEII